MESMEAAGEEAAKSTASFFPVIVRVRPKEVKKSTKKPPKVGTIEVGKPLIFRQPEK